MFALFRRTSTASLHGETPHISKPVIEWCPTQTSRAARALFHQAQGTSFFLGALNTRQGFHMRTMPDGLETGTNADLKIAAEIGETEAILRIAGVDPARVALMSIGTAIAECLDGKTQWDIQTDGTQQRLQAEVAIPEWGLHLHIVSRADLVDPLETGKALDGTVVTLQLRRLN